MKRVLMTDHSILSATENRCLNCGNDSPCSCTEPMPAAEVYARHRERQAAAAGQRYEPHCDLAAARAENERLTKERDEARAERDALMADPLYIIGVNHGWEEAVDYGQAHPVARAQMAGVSDEVLSELRPCPFCGGPVSFQGAAIRCNSFSCNASMSPRWTKAVVGSAKGDPDERFTLAKADCQRRWNIRATEADLQAEVERLRANAKGMRALLCAGCDLLSLESEALRKSVNIIGEPDRLSDDPEDAPTIAAITEIEDWIASVKATLFPPALSPESDGGQDGQ